MKVEKKRIRKDSIYYSVSDCDADFADSIFLVFINFISFCKITFTLSSLVSVSLTHFSPISHFYTLWKRQKTIGHQKEIWAIFDILMTITLEVNVITTQMTPFFSSTLRALSLGISHFGISISSTFNSMGSPLYIALHCVLVFKIYT